MSNKINISELFNGLQNQMIAQLNTNREFIKHPGTKGDSLENVWIEWLREYLPNRYNVDNAIVIDSAGHLSHQMDLVIYDQQYTPFVFKQNGIYYIPAEGVYAVFEVKPELTKDYIIYAGEKIESVRMLKRSSASIIDIGIKKKPRPLTKIMGGILASESRLKTKITIGNHLKSLKGLQGIDIGCAVDFASFYVDYEGEYDAIPDVPFQKLNKNIHDYYNNRSIKSIEFSKKEKSLVTFFLQLMRYLQQSIGTVAAIDLGKYSNAIQFPINDEL